MKQLQSILTDLDNKVITKHQAYDLILVLFNIRHIAMEWWNTLGSAGRTRMCDIHTELVGSIRRWETLTGREIQMLYESEH